MSLQRLDSPAEKPKAASPYESPSVESNVESTHQQSSLVEYGPLPLLRGRVPDRSIRQGGNGPRNMNISGVMSRASSAEDSGLSQSTTGQVAPETTTPQGSSNNPIRHNRANPRFVLNMETGVCHEWIEHPDIIISSTSTYRQRQSTRRLVQDKTALIQKYQNRVFKNYGFTEPQVLLLLRQFEQMSLRVQKLITLPNHVKFARKWDEKMEQEAAMKERQRLLLESEKSLSTDSQSPVEETCSNRKKRRIEQNLTPQEGASNLDKGAFEQKDTLTCCCCGYEQIAVVFTEVIQDQGPSTSDSTQDVFGEEKFFICSECGIQQEVGFLIQGGLEQSIPTSSEHTSGQSGDFAMAQDALQHGRNTNGQKRSHQEEMLSNQNGIGHEQRSSLPGDQEQAVQSTSLDNNSLEFYIRNTWKLHQNYLKFIHDALRDYPSFARQQDLDNIATLGNADRMWQACFDRNRQVLDAANRALDRAALCHKQNPQTPALIASFKKTLEIIRRKLERVVQASKYLVSGKRSAEASKENAQ